MAIERKRADTALHQAEERYRAFITQSTEGIWRVEFDEPLPVDQPEAEQIEHFYRHSYLAECNDAMAQMYGYASAQELSGTRLGDLLVRSDPNNVEMLRAFLRSGYRLADVESHERDRVGQPKVFLNNLVGIVEDGLLKRAWGTQRDITDLKRLEDQLRQAQKMEARSEEHTSELQSHSDLVCRLLLEKKKRNKKEDIERKAKNSTTE